MNLYSKCWSEVLDDRPSCEEVYRQLEKLFLDQLSVDNQVKKKLLGDMVELVSPAATTMHLSEASELIGIISRIVALIDTARYNCETLPIIKLYMMQVKQTILDNRDTIDIPCLTRALNEWEKFLV